MNLFLSIDGVQIDGITENDYTAYEEELGVSDRMISGRRVEELRSTIWVVQVNYASIDAETMMQLQTALHSTRRHILFFLPPDGSNEVKTGYFHLMAQPQPTLSRWIDGHNPVWSGFTLRFEEIDGHD